MFFIRRGYFSREGLQTYDESGNVINTYTYGLQRIESKAQTNETYLYDDRGSVVGSVSGDVMYMGYPRTRLVLEQISLLTKRGVYE